MPQEVLQDRTLVAPRSRWFKGNLHCHSYWSDGLAFPDQAVRDYREAGFDFCALTDHNCPDSNPAPYYAAGNTAPMHPKFATAWTQPYRQTT